MVFSTFYEASLMARLASYVTDQETSIERISGNGKYRVISGKIMHRYNDELDFYKNGKLFWLYVSEFPELDVFDLFDQMIADNSIDKPNWWSEAESKKIESFKKVTKINLSRKSRRIKRAIEIENGERNINLLPQAGSEEWEKQALKALEDEEKEQEAAAEFERKLDQWNGGTEKDEGGYWNGHDWVYTKEEGDGEDRPFGWL